MKKLLAPTLAATLAFACAAAPAADGTAAFTLAGPVKTTPFKQAGFKWRVTPRHDYSKTFATKLFLVQAEFDKDYMGRFKTRDNGRSTVYMTCEQALEAIKGMDEITLGLPKIVYLVGWQYNGHDSKYPAFFEGCEDIKRPGDATALDSIRWLMREAKKHHTTVSLHINLFDAYPDSPLFDEYAKAGVLARDKDGNYVRSDWGYKVDYASEWAKGLLQKRVDRLCEILPVAEAGTIHVDAFHNNVPRPRARPDGRISIVRETPISPWYGGTHEGDLEAKRKIVAYFDAKGIDVTTEGGDMDIGGGTEGWFPMYWWYSDRRLALTLKASQACGGGCTVKAFGDNVNAEAVFRANPDMSKAFDAFKDGFCKKTLICQYLNRFDRKELLEGRDGSIGVFADGVRTLYRNGRLSVEKDGSLLSDGFDVFIPAAWLGDGAIVAYSEKGCTRRRWKIPSGSTLAEGTKGWRIGADGRKTFNNFKIEGRFATITLAPGEMVLLR